MTKTTILMTSIIAMTFILLVTTSSAYAQVSNFYWTETTGGFGNFNGEVLVADSATKTITPVISGGFDRIDDVEIDPLAGKLWWNNWDPGFFNAGPHEGIYSSNLDGTGQVQVTGSLTPGAPQFSTTNGNASGLIGIVLDPVNQKVFFTRGVSYAQNFPPNSGGEVSRVNMDGTGYLKLNVNNDSWHPDGIELDSSTNTLLWGDPGVVNGITATGPVNCMDTSGGNRQVAQFPFAPFLGRSLALDTANGLLFYSSHAASGQFGRSSGGGIFVTSPCPSVAPTQVLADPTTGIPDIELDAANMRIYWTDYARGEIRSASYDAAGNLGLITIELSNLNNPYGLALELAALPADHYLGYKVKETKHTDKFEKVTVTLSDQFETDALYTVEKPERLFNPVDKNGEGISDEITHLLGYKIKSLKGEPKFEKVTDVLVTNQFGDLTVDVKKPKLLLVPSSKDLSVIPSELDSITVNHYKCYDAKETKDTPKFEKRQVTLSDPNFGETKVFEVKKPKHLCTPVDKNGEGIVDPENHLMCYDLKKLKDEPKFEKRNVFTNNQFGPEDLEVKKEHLLCVPSIKTLP